MSGYKRGWKRERGLWRTNLEGYTYLGPCKCGAGPDAYYQEKRTGRIVHARALFPFGVPYTLENKEIRAEILKLKEEKRGLKKNPGT